MAGAPPISMANEPGRSLLRNKTSSNSLKQAYLPIPTPQKNKFMKSRNGRSRITINKTALSLLMDQNKMVCDIIVNVMMWCIDEHTKPEYGPIPYDF